MTCETQLAREPRGGIVLVAAILMVGGCGGRTRLRPQVSSAAAGGNGGYHGAPGGAGGSRDAVADVSFDGGSENATRPDLRYEDGPDAATEVGLNPDGKVESNDGSKRDGNATDVRDAPAIAEVGIEARNEVGKEAGGEPRIPMLKLLAGQLGGPGDVDGIGTAARFCRPEGVICDRVGNLFVADTGNQTIRKVVLATGEVTTLAGSPGFSGSDDGIGANARFDCPSYMASDGAGNLFVADTYNHTIRKIVVATGDVTTFVGSPEGSGSTDGSGENARFNFPEGLTTDGKGNLFIVDRVNFTIRKMVIALAAVTTLAGSPGNFGNDDGNGVNARFDYPSGIASDGAGNLYVADDYGHTIRKIVVATGDVTTLAGSPGKYGSDDGIGATAQFTSPRGIASDGAGNLFVADGHNDTIRKIVIATGDVTTLAGSAQGCVYADGNRANARFCQPEGVASDGAGNLFVADSGNHTIRKIVVATGDVTTFAGSITIRGNADGSGTAARFVGPEGLASDGADNLFIADGSEIRKIVLATGAVTTVAGSQEIDGSVDGAGTIARFSHLAGMASDGAGNLFVADRNNCTIRKIVIATGDVTTLAGSAGSRGSDDGIGASARFDYPEAVAIDGVGNLFVADTGNDTIRKIVIATGDVTTLAGSAKSHGSTDGVGAGAQFHYPEGVATDGAGNLFVADGYNATIRKIVIATGAVTTLAGSPGTSKNIDGIGSAARFACLEHLASDGKGNLFVSQSCLGANTIRKVAIATGEVTTVVGIPDHMGVVLGPLPAQLACPSGLAVGPTGDLFIADSCENVILMAQF